MLSFFSAWFKIINFNLKYVNVHYFRPKMPTFFSYEGPKNLIEDCRPKVDVALYPTILNYIKMYCNCFLF